LIQNNLYNREFVRRWWNWEEYLEQTSEVGSQRSEAQPRSGDIFVDTDASSPDSRSNRNAVHFDSSGLGLNEDDSSINISRLRRDDEDQAKGDEVSTGSGSDRVNFEDFERALKQLYAEYTFNFATKESGV